MSVLILSSSIIFVYAIFWIFLSGNHSSNNLDWDKAIKKISKNKSDNSEELDKSENDTAVVSDNPEPFVISEIPWIISTQYAKYNFLNYSVRELSYPEEKTRFYAVVTITGGDFNKNKVNSIIQFKGPDKKNIYSYGLIPPEFLNINTPISIKHRIWTFDEVKRRLNLYIKDKLNGLENSSNENWMAYYNSYAYFFDTVEDATFALCAFKQIVDEKLRKKSLSINDISENVINVKFEE